MPTSNNDQPDDRSNAMLTKAQRKFIVGEKEYAGKHAKQQRYQMRTAIRQRVRDSLLDFQLLFENMDDGERERIFDVAGDWGEASSRDEREEQRELRYALADTIGFLYLGLDDTARGFKHFLERGILRAANKQAPDGRVVNAQTDFSVSVEKFPEADMESVAERVENENFDDLTEYELREYAKVTAGMEEFDPEAVIEANLERYGTGVADTGSEESDGEGDGGE